MPQTFNFPYHKQATAYPTEGTNLKLGGGWSFNSKPSSPPQRSFHLTFEALKYYGTAGNVDVLTDAEINLGALENFYREHGLHTEFIYPHPVYGPLLTKFSRPIEIPEGSSGGGGAIRGLTVTLLEQPT